MPRWYDLVPAHLTVVLDRFLAECPTGEIALDLRHGHILSGSVRAEIAEPEHHRLGVPLSHWYEGVPDWLHATLDAFVLGGKVLPTPTGQITIRVEHGRVVSGSTRGVILEDRTPQPQNGNAALVAAR